MKCTVCEKGKMIKQESYTDSKGKKHDVYKCNKCNHIDAIEK